MKKFFMIFAAMFMLAFTTTAQTVVSVNDTTMGYIEKYPAWLNITEDTVITNDTLYTFDYDSIISVDTIYGPHSMDIIGIDTSYLCVDTNFAVDTAIVYDTVWSENCYDYRAVAYESYTFEHWEIIITWVDSTEETVYDTIYDCDSVDGEYYCNDGWLITDGGVPEVTDDDTVYTSILITAYFASDSNSLGIESNSMNRLNIYPNPAVNNITIDGEIVSTAVYDMSGKLIYHGNTNIIDVRNFIPGTYFICIRQKDESVTTVKFIKQ